ncbi:hypothetical protein PoB_003253700 [Plakobranchus ocellatus]|uniref:Hexosyltransferase n=1 Tax=Plakobranchus ocellatus TaxID=259542 RepID=A0AAV4AG67_9GAST|nr:hypothetical protein PoB_003253700 [Plakobranchus ocellatus]
MRFEPRTSDLEANSLPYEPLLLPPLPTPHSDLLALVVDRAKILLGRQSSLASPTTPPSSPSKTRRPKNQTSGQTTVVIPVMKREGGRELISYQMAPRPKPQPLPCFLRICYQVCCGGNMKYVVFPTLMAVTLGLFLAFSRAVSSTSLSQGYSHYQNSRQLSEDDPAYMARGHLLFPGILGDNHNGLFDPVDPAMARQQFPWRGLGGGIVGGGGGGESCDCSRCEVDTKSLESDPVKFKRLVKHSFQHFYGHQELALQMEAFVPSKNKLWTLSPTFYITASHVCSDAHSLLAVVIVHAHHRHSAERNAIRETWGRVARGNAWPRRQVRNFPYRLIVIMTR